MKLIIILICLIKLSNESKSLVSVRFPYYKTCEWLNMNETSIDFINRCAIKHVVLEIVVPDYIVIIDTNKYAYYKYIIFTPSNYVCNKIFDGCMTITQLNTKTVICNNIECLHTSHTIEEKIRCCYINFIFGFKSMFKNNYHFL